MKLYTTEEATEILKCGKSRIAELVSSGRLRAAKPGRSLIFRQEWLEDFLEREADAKMQETKTAKPRAHRYPDLDRYMV